MVNNLRTEALRCILCKRELTSCLEQQEEELFICAECQAYFCSQCRHAISDYSFCPAAQLLGVNAHKLKFIKLLPPSMIKPTTTQTGNTPVVKTKIKILPSKNVKILKDDIDPPTKAQEQKRTVKKEG